MVSKLGLQVMEEHVYINNLVALYWLQVHLVVSVQYELPLNRDFPEDSDQQKAVKNLQTEIYLHWYCIIQQLIGSLRCIQVHLLSIRRIKTIPCQLYCTSVWCMAAFYILQCVLLLTFGVIRYTLLQVIYFYVLRLRLDSLEGCSKIKVSGFAVKCLTFQVALKANSIRKVWNRENNHWNYRIW